MIKKGIILLGGKGSRLFPVTKNLNKHLLPIYNKPMFYYPLSVLMLGGIRDFLFIVNENQEQYFKNSLGNLSDLGIKVSFEQKMCNWNFKFGVLELFLNLPWCLILL